MSAAKLHFYRTGSDEESHKFMYNSTGCSITKLWIPCLKAFSPYYKREAEGCEHAHGNVFPNSKKTLVTQAMQSRTLDYHVEEISQYHFSATLPLSVQQTITHSSLCLNPSAAKSNCDIEYLHTDTSVIGLKRLR